MKRSIIIAVLCISLLVLITGCLQQSTDRNPVETQNEIKSDDSAVRVTETGADEIKSNLTVEVSEVVKMTIVKMETNMGIINIELFDKDAPITTSNFKKLVNQGFYDGTKFHRVIKSFMIQGGDPRGDGTGGPGYTIKDEFYKGSTNVRGTISMANAGPNTGGSQFFINTVDNTFLDGKHPVFGEVVEGMDVVDAIVNTKTGPGDKPIKDVILTKVSVE